VIAGSDGRLFTVSRDREDELAAVAKTLKRAGAAAGAALDRRAVVFKRPLPYVYLARDVFSDAGVPYQTFDALPLAAEPYAAALDLVFEFVTSEFTREPVVALLSSPHFHFDVGGHRYPADRRRRPEPRLHRGRLFWGRRASPGVCSHGNRQGSSSSARRGGRGGGAQAAHGSANRRQWQLAALMAFLAAHDRVPAVSDPLRERHLRARRAIISAVQRPAPRARTSRRHAGGGCRNRRHAAPMDRGTDLRAPRGDQRRPGA